MSKSKTQALAEMRRIRKARTVKELVEYDYRRIKVTSLLKTTTLTI